MQSQSFFHPGLCTQTSISIYDPKGSCPAKVCTVSILQLKHVMYPMWKHCMLQPDEIPVDHILIWMFECTAQEEIWLWLCNRGGSSLCVVVAALCTYTCWCITWSFNILRILTFMMEVRVNSAWNTCWTYKALLLIHSLMMEPWSWNMWELAPEMKCVL